MPSNIPHLAGDLHIRSFLGQHALRWTFPPCAALGICEKINRDSPGRLPSLFPIKGVVKPPGSQAET